MVTAGGRSSTIVECATFRACFGGAEFQIIQPDIERGGAVRQPAGRNQVDAGGGDRFARSRR